MAAVLSVPFEAIGSCLPVSRLMRGMHNMALLQLWNKPAWQSIRGGSYADRGRC